MSSTDRVPPLRGADVLVARVVNRPSQRVAMHSSIGVQRPWLCSRACRGSGCSQQVAGTPFSGPGPEGPDRRRRNHFWLWDLPFGSHSEAQRANNWERGSRQELQEPSECPHSCLGYQNQGGAVGLQTVSSLEGRA